MKPLDILLILVFLLFATGLIVDKRWAPERVRHEQGLKLQRDHLDKVADLLRDFKKRTGRYPTMEQGLESVEGLREATYSGQFKQLAPALADLPYVRTPHGVPYLYENRRPSDDGAPGTRGAFKGSPTHNDRKRERYSQRVDDGIFITSLGLRHDVGRVFGDAWLDALIWFGGGLVVTLTIAYIFARNRSKTAERYRGINATIIVGVAVILSLVFLLTGGQARLSASRRAKFEAVGTRADLATEYLSFLKEWSDVGVYSKDAYASVSKQLATEFGLSLRDEAAPDPASKSDAQPPSGGSDGGPK